MSTDTDTASVEALAKKLALHNRWRRGDEDVAAPRGAELGLVIEDICAAVRSLAAERDEDQAVIAVWRGRTERAEAERDALARRVADLEADGIHSCHPECERPVCVLVRERDALLAKVAELESTLALQQASYEREIRIEVEAERERCAKLCEGMHQDDRPHAYAWVIRTTPKEPT